MTVYVNNPVVPLPAGDEDGLRVDVEVEDTPAMDVVQRVHFG